ncbi:hypothetical protein CLOM_g9276 [Closterium sp. NIES-68]|nr:hypothetical protein CLOM_g9276 [Closterium sp. NIES-68]
MVGNPAAVSAAVSRHRHDTEGDSGDGYGQAGHQQPGPHFHHADHSHQHRHQHHSSHSAAPASARVPPVQGIPVAYGQPLPPVAGYSPSQPYAQPSPYAYGALPPSAAGAFHPGASVGVTNNSATVMACPGCGEYYPLPYGAESWRCKRCGKMNHLRPENFCAVM